MNRSNPYRMWHGTPYGPIRSFSEFAVPRAYFTPSPAVAKDYTHGPGIASGRRPAGVTGSTPSIYEVEVDLEPDEVFDTRRPEHQALYEEIRQEIKRRFPNDRDEWIDRDLIRTPSDVPGWSGHYPGYGTGLALIPYLKDRGFAGLLLSEGSQGASLLVFDRPGERAKIIRDVDVGSVNGRSVSGVFNPPRNSDVGIRELERRWEATRSQEDLSLLRVARARAGVCSNCGKTEQWAFFGHWFDLRAPLPVCEECALSHAGELGRESARCAIDAAGARIEELRPDTWRPQDGDWYVLRQEVAPIDSGNDAALQVIDRAFENGYRGVISERPSDDLDIHERNPTVPLGDCFRWAYHFQKEHGGTLVHGVVRDPQSRRSYPHAWVVLDGRVWDWQTDALGSDPLTVAKFRRIRRPTDEVEFEDEEAAAIAMLRHGHYGPWSRR